MPTNRAFSFLPTHTQKNIIKNSKKNPLILSLFGSSPFPSPPLIILTHIISSSSPRSLSLFQALFPQFIFTYAPENPFFNFCFCIGTRVPLWGSELASYIYTVIE
ncbi:hypothetical protein Dimus_023942 [Dionaea muscipula]